MDRWVKGTALRAIQRFYGTHSPSEYTVYLYSYYNQLNTISFVITVYLYSIASPV